MLQLIKDITSVAVLLRIYASCAYGGTQIERFQFALGLVPDEAETVVAVNLDDETKSNRCICREIVLRPFIAVGEELQKAKGVQGVAFGLAFQPTKGLGAWEYKGCHFLIFPVPQRDRLRHIWESIQRRGAKATVSGQECVVVGWESEGHSWDYYFARLAEDILVAATDRDTLASLISTRMAPKKAHPTTSPFPEVKYADSNASCWAARNFRVRDSDDPSSSAQVHASMSFEDNGGVGIRFTCDCDNSKSRELLYISRSKNIRQVAEWAGKIPAVSRVVVESGAAKDEDSESVLRIQFSQDSPEERDLADLVILRMLGFGVTL